MHCKKYYENPMESEISWLEGKTESEKFELWSP